jgi:hypothetical protein
LLGAHGRPRGLRRMKARRCPAGARKM